VPEAGGGCCPLSALRFFYSNGGSMGRISLEGKDETITEVVVGWDPPLNCFFVQVYRAVPDDCDDDSPFMWRWPVSLQDALAVVKVYADTNVVSIDVVTQKLLRQAHEAGALNPCGEEPPICTGGPAEKVCGDCSENPDKA